MFLGTHRHGFAIVDSNQHLRPLLSSILRSNCFAARMAVKSSLLRGTIGSAGMLLLCCLITFLLPLSAPLPTTRQQVARSARSPSSVNVCACIARSLIELLAWTEYKRHLFVIQSVDRPGRIWQVKCDDDARHYACPGGRFDIDRSACLGSVLEEKISGKAPTIVPARIRFKSDCLKAKNNR